MKKLQFDTSINAPKQRVWEILWGKTTYPKWTAVFAEGSDVETDWQEGSKTIFHDGKGSGMLSTIDRRVDNELMSIKHLGMVKDGKEILEGPEVDPWKGALEQYFLKENNGSTDLHVELDSGEDESMNNYFMEKFPLALEQVKNLAENN
jgi:uncharacterized protein YndB with AHSA1/START domain